MWNNLAGKVGTQDWSGALQKLGNAVAPPPGTEDYDEDEDDYEEDEYTDEEYEEYEEENNEAPALGFVGLLARALDHNDARYDESRGNEEASRRNYTIGGDDASPGPSQPEGKPHPVDDSSQPQIVGTPLPETTYPVGGQATTIRSEEGNQAEYPQVEKLPVSPLVPFTDTATHDKRNDTFESGRYESRSQPLSSNSSHSRQEQLHRPPNSPILAELQASSPPITPGRPETMTPVENSGTKDPQILPTSIQTGKETVGLESAPSPKSEVQDACLKLREAENKILELEERLLRGDILFEEQREKLMIDFQKKEARRLEASAEEYQHKLMQVENQYRQEISALETRMACEKKEFIQREQSLKNVIEQSKELADRTEKDLRTMTTRHESTVAKVTQQEQRAHRATEEKLAATMALVDERDAMILELNKKINSLESVMNEHEEGVEEVEQEVEELQVENDELQEKIDRLQDECMLLKKRNIDLEDQATKLGPLQMELTMLREERDRERAQNSSVVQTTITSHSQVEAERDSAIAEARDLKQQLSALSGDLSILRADQERLLTANTNLQTALEAFQDERQAEIKMLEDQRMESENAIAAANAEALTVMREAHAQELRIAELKAQEALERISGERDDVRLMLKTAQTENVKTRRLLDEAIQRLKNTQEDVVDRTLMKNILLDWCTMKEKEKRIQVLELMASVLHFTDKEKESVHLTHVDIDSVRSKVVGAIAAPLPPSKASVDKLEGENVSEKWINFLLAETDDDR